MTSFVQPLEDRRLFAATPLLLKPDIDWSAVVGDTLYYTQRAATDRQPDRVRLYRFDLETGEVSIMAIPGASQAARLPEVA